MSSFKPTAVDYLKSVGFGLALAIQSCERDDLHAALAVIEELRDDLNSAENAIVDRVRTKLRAESDAEKVEAAKRRAAALRERGEG